MSGSAPPTKSRVTHELWDWGDTAGDTVYGHWDMPLGGMGPEGAWHRSCKAISKRLDMAAKRAALLRFFLFAFFGAVAIVIEMSFAFEVELAAVLCNGKNGGGLVVWGNKWRIIY